MKRAVQELFVILVAFLMVFGIVVGTGWALLAWLESKLGEGALILVIVLMTAFVSQILGVLYFRWGAASNVAGTTATAELLKQQNSVQKSIAGAEAAVTKGLFKVWQDGQKAAAKKLPVPNQQLPGPSEEQSYALPSWLDSEDVVDGEYSFVNFH